MSDMVLCEAPRGRSGQLFKRLWDVLCTHVSMVKRQGSHEHRVISGGGLCDYELQRLENIKRNQAKLNALQIDKYRSGCGFRPKKLKSPSKKTLSSKKSRTKAPTPPTRRSSRAGSTSKPSTGKMIDWREEAMRAAELKEKQQQVDKRHQLS